ncbi:UNVERIFIED_CONTAM: hypothetical protein K2H54_022349 [Gekko kuhli]
MEFVADQALGRKIGSHLKMPPSALEVAMQTMASVLSDYVEEKNGVPVITKDGLDQLVEQQFPNSEMKRKGRGRATNRPRGKKGTRKGIPRQPEDLAVSVGREDSTGQLRGQKSLQISDPIDDADIVDEALTFIISIIENNFLRITAG